MGKEFERKRKKKSERLRFFFVKVLRTVVTLKKFI